MARRSPTHRLEGAGRDSLSHNVPDGAVGSKRAARAAEAHPQAAADIGGLCAYGPPARTSGPHTSGPREHGHQHEPTQQQGLVHHEQSRQSQGNGPRGPAPQREVGRGIGLAHFCPTARVLNVCWDQSV